VTDEEGMADTRTMDRPRHNLAALILSVGIVALLEVVLTIEWSSPSCSRGNSDGPVAAAFGMPFPYVRWCTALSWQYDMMPHVYVLNLVILVLLALPVSRAVVMHARRPRLAFVVGIALGCLGVAARVFLLLGLEAWRPVMSTAQLDDDYWEYRPVGVASHRHYNCTPSTFWFGAPQGRVSMVCSAAQQADAADKARTLLDRCPRWPLLH
jgi:hypothetical protein